MANTAQPAFLVGPATSSMRHVPYPQPIYEPTGPARVPHRVGVRDGNRPVPPPRLRDHAPHRS